MFPSINLFDALLSLFATIGIWPVLLRMRRIEARSPLESSLYRMMIFMLGLLLSRAPYVGLHIDNPFGQLTYFFATLFALSVFLYYETLLRRHMPLFLKLYASIGTAYFLSMAILGRLNDNREQLMMFGTYLVILTVGSAIFALFRDRRDYSRSENSLIDLSVLALVILLPLFLSDIAFYRFPGIPRMGVIGALIFCYISMYNQALFYDSWHLIRKLVKALLFALVAWAVCLSLVGMENWEISVRLLLLFIMINLIFRIAYAIKHLDGEDDLYGFVKAVAEADKKSTLDFLRDIRRYFGKVDWSFFGPSELKPYHALKWIDLFRNWKSDYFSLFELRRLVQEDELSGENKLIMDEIIHALESEDMTHLCVIGRNRPVFIFFRIPMVGYEHMVAMQTKLVVEFANLIEKERKPKSSAELA